MKQRRETKQFLRNGILASPHAARPSDVSSLFPFKVLDGMIVSFVSQVEIDRFLFHIAIGSCFTTEGALLSVVS